MVTRSTRLSLELLGEDLGEVEPFPTDAEITEWTPFFRANWKNPSATTVTQSWLTDVVTSKVESVEERRSLWERPIRNFSSELTGLRQHENIRLQAFCYRTGSNRQPMPIIPDRVRTWFNFVGGKQIAARVGYMRFYKGQRIAIVKQTFEPWATGDALYVEIDYVDADYIYLKDNLLDHFDKGTYLYPLIDAEIVERTSGVIVTDHASSVAISYQERNGMCTLPPAWNGEIELAASYAYGYPIFEFRPNYSLSVTYSIVRSILRSRAGRATHIDEDGTRPFFELGFSIQSMSRKASWELLRFFDSRRGRWKPFFLPSEQKLIEAVDVTTSYIQVVQNARQQDIIDFYDYIFVKYNDGSSVIRKIDSVVGDKIYFDISISNTSEVRYVNYAFFGRFNDDKFTQIWQTDHHCHSSFRFKELPDEVNSSDF